MMSDRAISKRRPKAGPWCACGAGFLESLSACLLFVTVAGCHGAPLRNEGAAKAGEQPILAHYRAGEVSVAEYCSWLAFRGVEDSDPEDLTDILLAIAEVETLAAEFEASEPSIPLPLESRLLARRISRLRKEVENTVRAQVEVSDEEVERAATERRKEYERPQRVRLSNIFLRWPEGGGLRDEVRERLESIRTRLSAGEDFAEVASAESESQTRLRGGAMGVIWPGDLTPEVERVAMQLEPGELSGVIETSRGATLLRCDGIEPAVRPSFEEVLGKVRQVLERDRFRNDLALLERQARERIRFRPEAVSYDSTGADPVVVFRGEVPWLRRSEFRELLRLTGAGQAPKGVGKAGDQAWTQLITGLALLDHAEREGLHKGYRASADLHWAERELLAAQALAARVTGLMEPPSEESLRQEFAQNPDAYAVEAETSLRVIVRYGPRRDVRRLYSAAEKVRSAILTGKLSWGDAARQGSEHPSREHGGALGDLSERRVRALGPVVGRRALDLEPGVLSEPLVQPVGLGLRIGVWILRVDHRKPGRPMTFEEARPLLEKHLGADLARELQGVQVGNLRSALRRTLRSHLDCAGCEAGVPECP